MRVRLIPLLLLNIALSAAVAFGVITLMGGDGEGQTVERVVTFEVIITATPNPNTTPQVIIVTPTPGPGTPVQREIPTNALDQGEVPTLDGGASPNGDGGDPTLNLPQGCITHVIDSGETPFVIAEQYGVSGFDVLTVNNLTEEDARFLQIGETLIIPLEGCPIDSLVQQEESTPDETTDTETEQPDVTSTPNAEGEIIEGDTPTPTLTLAPTAANAQVEIVDVIGAGDITLESIVISNRGSTINLDNWTLSDADGNTFNFPAGRRIFNGGGVTIFSREGENTPINLFWGEQEALFQPGDVITLRDDNGDVQATYRIP